MKNDKTCDECYSPYINDLQKVEYNGMTFCSLNCLLLSDKVDISKIDTVYDLEQERDEIKEDFDELKKEHDKLESENQILVSELEKLLKSYDDDFEKGNEKLDTILLKISELINE